MAVLLSFDEMGACGRTYLEEALEPPDLEDADGTEDSELENTPPLDSGIGALGRVPVGALANNNVRLLVLDLGHELGESADLPFQRVLGRLALGDVDDAVDIEADLLGVGGPVFVAEAVGEAAVHVGGEGVVARADGAFVDLVGTGGVLDLCGKKTTALERGGRQLNAKKPSLLVNLPRSRHPDFHCHQTPCRQPGR